MSSSHPEERHHDERRSKRRRFFGWLGGAAGLVALGGLDGILIEPNLLDVNVYDVPIVGLPDRFDGYTIAHVTDLHFGRERGAHTKAIEWLEANDPDLVVCTGDLVESVQALERFEPYARRLVAAADDIVTVWGNWEWREGRYGARAIRRRFDDIGLPILSNEWREPEEGLLVAGADDPVTGHFDPDALFGDVPDAEVRLFLAHAPIVFDRDFPRAPEFALSLAGHTHGGQIRLGPYAPITPPSSGRFTSGFYDTSVGRAYVSRGIGMTTIRVRLMCPPELPVFTLRSRPA